jgi:hypothetical protein
MTMNPLPPQAYTKETMLKAYQWLMVQNSNIKELATTPDILVSLFLKATRDGSSALERPSIQNFKNELKSLSGIMSELEKPAQQKQERLEAIEHPPCSESVRNSELIEVLDPTTRAMIREVKSELNLGSEVEALRMLVKIGYNKSKGLFK